MTETVKDKIVLMANPLPAPLVDALHQVCQLVGPVSHLDGSGLSAQEKQAEVLLAFSSTRLDRVLIDALPHLRLIICYGSGTEFVDINYLKSKGIALTNAAGANARSVAELAMGLMLNGCRKIKPSEAYLRSGAWQGNALNRYEMSKGLEGRRVGIYGLGEIGLQIGRMAQVFTDEIGYTSRTRKDVDYRYFADIAGLAEWADIMVLAARGSAENYHVVDARILRLLGPEGYLINIARGMLIDETALCEALEGGELGGAALDVFETEPVIPTRLLRLENALLTPHIAANTFSAQQTQQDRMLNNVICFFQQQALTGQVC